MNRDVDQDLLFSEDELHEMGASLTRGVEVDPYLAPEPEPPAGPSPLPGMSSVGRPGTPWPPLPGEQPVMPSLAVPDSAPAGLPSMPWPDEGQLPPALPETAAGLPDEPLGASAAYGSLGVVPLEPLLVEPDGLTMPELIDGLSAPPAPLVGALQQPTSGPLVGPGSVPIPAPAMAEDARRGGSAGNGDGVAAASLPDPEPPALLPAGSPPRPAAELDRVPTPQPRRPGVDAWLGPDEPAPSPPPSRSGADDWQASEPTPDGAHAPGPTPDAAPAAGNTGETGSDAQAEAAAASAASEPTPGESRRTTSKERTRSGGRTRSGRSPTPVRRSSSGRELGAAPERTRSDRLPPAAPEDEETVLDEDDQLPLTAEELAKVQATRTPSWLAELDERPLFEDDEAEPEPAPVAAAPATAPGAAAGARPSAPPPPPPPPPRPTPVALPQNERRPALHGAEQTPPPSSDEWPNRVFGPSYLEFLRRRSPRFLRHQVDFLVQLLDLPAGAEILDLACGDGAHALLLAQHGYSVTGIDLSESLISEAQQQAEATGTQNVRFVRADMRGLCSEALFDAILSLGTSFGFHDDQTNFKVLKAVAAALRHGGKLLLEVLNRDSAIDEQPLRTWFQVGSMMVLEEGRIDYGRSQLRVHRTLAFPDGKQQEDDIRLRLYSLHELNVLLRVMGLEVLQTLGSSSRRLPFLGRTCRQIVLLAEKQ